MPLTHSAIDSALKMFSAARLRNGPPTVDDQLAYGRILAVVLADVDDQALAEAALDWLRNGTGWWPTPTDLLQRARALGGQGQARQLSMAELELHAAESWQETLDALGRVGRYRLGELLKDGVYAITGFRAEDELCTKALAAIGGAQALLGADEVQLNVLRSRWVKAYVPLYQRVLADEVQPETAMVVEMAARLAGRKAIGGGR